MEEQTEGYTGAFKIQVAGPWTLAATVEKPRGDKVLSDHGARRELAQALAEGLRDHVADVRRRLPGVDRLVVQVDEPALAAVLGGKVPTASGWGRHRTVHPPEASDTLGWVLAAIAGAGAEPWVHSCAGGTPLALLRGAGARGLSVDLEATDAAGQDVLAEALEAGETVVLGARALAGARDGADREARHRVGAPVAGHGRSRSGDDRAQPGDLPDLRARGGVGWVDPARAGPAAGERRQPDRLRPAGGAPIERWSDLDAPGDVGSRPCVSVRRGPGPRGRRWRARRA